MLMCIIFFFPRQSLPSKKKATSAFIYQYMYVFNFLVIFLTKRNFFFIFSTLSQSLQLYSLVYLFPSLLPSFISVLISQRSAKLVHTPLSRSWPSICCLLCSLRRNNSYIMGFLKNEIQNRRFWRRMRRD